MKTILKSVTYVPGLQCYRCARLHKASLGLASESKESEAQQGARPGQAQGMWLAWTP